MKSLSAGLVRWLGMAAVADWLLARTLARSAIFMPKARFVIVLYQGLGFAGQVAATLAALLALAAMGQIAWQVWRTNRRLGAVLMWLSLPVLSLAFLFAAPTGWVAVGYQGLLLGAVVWLGLRMLGSQLALPGKTAAAFVGLALAASGLYQLVPAIYAASQWPGPPPLATWLFNAGELLIVLSPAGLWWAYARDASRREWLCAAAPVLAFLALRLANPALTGILAIWSVGLTLYLPWPLYAISLWLAGVTVLAALRRGEQAGWSVLLLFAGGYAPQLSTQAFLGLIALWLLAAPGPRPILTQRVAAPAEAHRPAGRVTSRAALS